MSFRFELVKQSAVGESFGMVVTEHNPITGEKDCTLEEAKEIMAQGIIMGEERTVQMNTRHLEARKLNEFFTVQTWQRIRQILGTLEGQMTVQELAHRWMSEIEETHMLEEIREQAATNDAVYAEGEIESNVCVD